MPTPNESNRTSEDVATACPIETCVPDTETPVPAVSVVIFPVPLNDTPLIVLAFCNAVAVAAFPVALPALPLTFPVTFPVTSPVTSPVKLPVTLPVTLPVKLPVTLPITLPVIPVAVIAFTTKVFVLGL